MSNWDDDLEFVDEPAGNPPGEAIGQPPRSSVPVTWTREQLIRLENEWRRLQRSYAYHPHVRVIPLRGDPPEEYQVEYRLRTLVMTADGQLEYASSCSVHVWLPPNFPHEPPLLRPITGIFHPNIVPQGVNLDRAWAGPASTLADVVRSVGAMVALQDYDIDTVWNETAMEWIQANPTYVPVDLEANLAYDAGGEPLARIIRFGARTLEQVRTQLKQTCDALIAAEGAPTHREVQAFAGRTRQALGVFLEDDVSEDIRSPASDLDDFARQLPLSAALWELVRRYRAAAATAFALSQQMRDAETGLAHETLAIDALVATDAGPGGALGRGQALGQLQAVTQTLRAIPPVAKLQLHQGNLDNLLMRGIQLLQEARNVHGRLVALPAMSADAFAGLLRARLDAETARTLALAIDANDKIREAFARLEPVAGKAKIHSQALKRLCDWREYADLLEKAEVMARRLLDYNAAGLQAYFVENEAGRFGPYELEQKLEMGGFGLAVRNPASTIIEIVGAENGAVIKRGENGTVIKGIPDPATGVKFPTTFRLTGNCDELAVQMDYLVREATKMLDVLTTRLRSPEGWLGRFNDLLQEALASGRVRIDHEALARRWRTIRDDVTSLRPFKERLATFRMLQRIGEMVPRLLDERSEARKTLADATNRVARIVAGSNTDMETGRLLIPSKWAKEYPEQLHRRDEAKYDIDKIGTRLTQAAADIRQRVDEPGLLGFADLPALTMLTDIPRARVDLEQFMTDEAIAARLAELEGVLGVRLKPEGWPSSATRAAADAEQARLREAELLAEADLVPDAVVGADEPQELLAGDDAPSDAFVHADHGEVNDAHGQEHGAATTAEEDYVDFGITLPEAQGQMTTATPATVPTAPVPQAPAPDAVPGKRLDPSAPEPSA